MYGVCSYNTCRIKFSRNIYKTNSFTNVCDQARTCINKRTSEESTVLTENNTGTTVLRPYQSENYFIPIYTQIKSFSKYFSVYSQCVYFLSFPTCLTRDWPLISIGFFSSYTFAADLDEQTAVFRIHVIHLLFSEKNTRWLITINDMMHCIFLTRRLS